MKERGREGEEREGMKERGREEGKEENICSELCKCK